MSSKVKDIKILESVKKGDRKVLEQLYDEYRGSFCTWVSYTYQCTEDDALEVYQKTFTIFYFNVKHGKLTTLTSSLKTYLYSIGKNVFRERFRAQKKSFVSLDDEGVHVLDKEAADIDYDILEEYENNHMKAAVRNLLEKIGDPCRTLLKLAFLKGYSTEAIVVEMGYSDERVVRKRKSLCIKKIREEYASFAKHI